MKPQDHGGEGWNSAWVLLLAGWLGAAGTVHALREPVAPAGPTLRRTLDVDDASPRELRRLPGIGATRAAAIAQTRWERGGEMFPLSQIAGIGPKTAERVEAWLAQDALRVRGLENPPASTE
jgi:hypothetical protein